MKLKLLALSLIATSLLSTSVMAQRTETVSDGVYTTLERGVAVDVLQELNLKRRLANGDKLLSVKVKVSKTRPNSKLRVLLNGELLGKYILSDRIPHVEIDLTGKSVSTLQLKSRGAYVERLSAVVKKKRVAPQPPRGGNGNLEVVKARIQRDLYDGSVLPVRKTLKQYTGNNLKGMVVKKIVLKGYSYDRYDRAYAQLVVNGSAVGEMKPVPVQSYRSGVVSKVVFQMPRIGQSVVGRDIRNIKIKVYGGDMFAQVLKAKYKQARRADRNSVRVNVNRTFSGYSAELLSQLVENSGRRIDYTRPIQSITFVTSGRGTIRVDAARRIQADYRARVGTRRVNILGDATVDEVRVVMNGNVSIHSVQIKYGRSYDF